MTSWREGVPQNVQDELDELCNRAIQLAVMLLEKQGEFFPAALVTDTQGQVAMKAIYDEELARDSAAYLAALIDMLRASREEATSVALISNAHSPDLKSDVIRVDLEHSTGPVLTIIAPYTLAKKGLFGKGRTVQIGQLSGAEGNRVVW